MIKKVLIINRGEIVLRIAKTLKLMGIKSVAIYSDIDSNSLHRFVTDEAIHIPGSTSIDTYLNFDKILEAVQKSGADAVHPGFGFVSENSNFVEFIKSHGIKFIGPEALSIKIMGDKIESKILAKNAGVTVIPGLIEPIDSLEVALEVANDIKYPVILKAAAGGGGKGIRIVRSDAELMENFSLTSSEALNNFNDGRIFIEKYIDNPRHIEIQILADKYGNVVHLGERECSIQRRHQKVIEEAPSPFLEKAGKIGAKIREEMGIQSINLAKKIGYYSVGTVEFVVDQEGNFYFLEVNTRLQVEHPVTEEVIRIKNRSGDKKIDLVEWMVRIENGDKLEFTQDDIYLSGNAIEARIYAENPEMNFIPSSGKVMHYFEPEINNVRMEMGVRKGSDVSIYYDPMIAKICVFGNNRINAINLIQKALSQLVIYGSSLKTNLNFLEQLIRLPEFINGDFSTNFIKQQYNNSFSTSLKLDSDEELMIYEKLLIASTILASNDFKFLSSSGFLDESYKKQSLQSLKFNILTSFDNFKDKQLIILDKQTNIFNIKNVNNKKVSSSYECISLEDNLLTIIDLSRKNNKNNNILNFKCYFDDLGYILEYCGYQLKVKIYPKEFSNFLQHMKNHSSNNDSLNEKFVISPLPGMVSSINVQEGDEVDISTNLVVIEAMKMQNIISANKKVVIKKIFVKQGDSVKSEQKLIEFD